ncbi:MAG: protein kinase [Silvibacterium sp.]
MAVPDRVGHYEIVEMLGRGGMGAVYRARDLALGRQVALKFLSSDFQKDNEAVDRFIQEAKSVAQLDHPNICTIYEIGTEANGIPFIAMACYEGETLRSRMDRGLMPAGQSVEIAVQMLRGLSKAHERGIVHRDIKPSNVMITPDGLAKVLDFGVAQLVGRENRGATQVGGTIPYMSPEQASGRIDERSDLWSVGVVLYEMLTGQLPFEGTTPNETIDKIFHQTPRNVCELRPGTPFRVARAVDRSLAKDARLRYQTAHAMIEDLLTQISAETETLPGKSAAERNHSEKREPSIAVLPFTSMGGGEEAGYFCDGLTEETIHALSRLKGLRVVSRTSAFEFKGKAQDIRLIADRLGVNSILEGSVRVYQSKMRVSLLLTNALDGYSLWSKRFDRELSDFFLIQEEIATSVAQSLCTTLTQENFSQMRSRPEGNMESWKLCLKARYHWHQRKPESFEKARALYEEAIKLDPGCGAAFTGLADCYRALAFIGVVDPRQVWPMALKFADRAIELDPSQPQAHIVKARYIQHLDRDRASAETQFKHAITLNPGDSEVHLAWAIFLVQGGEFGRALEELRLAQDLDPLNLEIAVGVALVQCYRGEYEEALKECLQTRELNPNYAEAFGCMAWIAEAQGRLEEAESWLVRLVAEAGRAPLSLAMLARHHALYGEAGKAREILSSLEELSSTRYVSPITFVFIFAALGEHEKALNYLERAYEVHDTWLSYVSVYPAFQPLRQYEKFNKILHRLGMAAEPENGAHSNRPE